jgi:hypothetical protein
MYRYMGLDGHACALSLSNPREQAVKSGDLK